MVIIQPCNCFHLVNLVKVNYGNHLICIAYKISLVSLTNYFYLGN